MQARIYRPTERNMAFLAGRLRAGELVAIPTETVYGLAAHALDATACANIFRVKGRPTHDPLIVHVASWTEVSAIAHVNDTAKKLAQHFWPGPLTLVLPKTSAVPKVVTAGRDSVAVRVPAHPVARRLLKIAAIPVAAPSANPFGYISPTTAEHVRDNLGGRIKYILDGGACSIGVESTIVDLRDPARPALLRPGAITKTELEQALGRKVSSPPRRRGKRPATEAQLAPGMLARHYSPRTPVVLHERITSDSVRPADEAFVFMRGPPLAPTRNVFWFDRHGELRGIARRLFATLREVDARGFKRIHVELAPGDGLAVAINDRLRRAAAR